MFLIQFFKLIFAEIHRYYISLKTTLTYNLNKNKLGT
jgi:hypothetical protein